MLMYSLLFGFSFLAIISAFCVIMAKNAVHSVFFLVLVFFSATGLLILLEVDYLAMVLLIVYVGAIAVLFLFVIMLLNLKIVELQENFYRYLPLSGFLSLVFLVEIFLLIQKEFNTLDNWFVGQDYFSWINVFFDSGTSLDKLSVLIYNYFFFVYLMRSFIVCCYGWGYCFNCVSKFLCKETGYYYTITT